MRYKLLLKNHPDEAKRLIQSAQESLDLRWETYMQLQSQITEIFQVGKRNIINQKIIDKWGNAKIALPGQR